MSDLLPICVLGGTDFFHSWCSSTFFSELRASWSSIAALRHSNSRSIMLLCNERHTLCQSLIKHGIVFTVMYLSDYVVTLIHFVACKSSTWKQPLQEETKASSLVVPHSNWQPMTNFWVFRCTSSLSFVLCHKQYWFPFSRSPIDFRVIPSY